VARPTGRSTGRPTSSGTPSRVKACVFGVLGNHDTAHIVPGLEAIGIRMLLNENELMRRGGPGSETISTAAKPVTAMVSICLHHVYSSPVPMPCRSATACCSGRLQLHPFPFFFRPPGWQAVPCGPMREKARRRLLGES
jgi:hypothetical protein